MLIDSFRLVALLVPDFQYDFPFEEFLTEIVFLTISVFAALMIPGENRTLLFP